MVFKKRTALWIVCCVCVTSGLYGQSSYAPYSMLGLGEIESRDYGRTAGMANIGIGMRDYNYLNPQNPASISSLDTSSFIFDVSLAGKYSMFNQRGKTEHTVNGNVKKISLGFSALPRWGLSFGLKPFSDVGYQIYSAEPVEGTAGTKDVYMEGSGGLYELYVSNGFRILKNLSVGVNSMYVSGVVKQVENQSETMVEKESRTSQFYNRFGVQYHTGQLTVGAAYGYRQKLLMKNKKRLYDGSYNLQDEVNDRSKSQFIPETIGVGFSYKNRKYIWGADYQYQKWSGLASGVNSVKIVDSYRINAGVAYNLNNERYYLVRNQGQLQAGASLAKSYVQISGKNAYNYAVTAGYSFPALRGEAYINLGLEYGNTFAAPTNYIKESYFIITLNCTFTERLFKVKLQ